MTSRFPTLLLLTLITLFWTSAMAMGQRYPFFVQPISVKDLKPMSDELKLSPSQVEVVIGFHETYGEQFNKLQEGELSELVDRAMVIGQDMNWMGGQVQIPERKEIESVIEAAVDVWEAFERIDREFFNKVRGLLHEEQFQALERFQNKRKVEAYRSIHLRLVRAFNDGSAARLDDMIKRLDLSVLEQQALYEPMDLYEREMIQLSDRLEKQILAAITLLLDEVDRLGIRDMDMMEMMAFFAEEDRQEELKAIFDEESVPVQETASKLSKLHWNTYVKVFALLPPDKALDFQERYFRDVYQAGQEVFETRSFIKRALDLPSVTETQRVPIQEILIKLNTDFDALSRKLAKAIETKRAYRTIAMMEEDELSPHQQAIDGYLVKIDSMAEDAMNATEMQLLPEQLEALDVKEPDEDTDMPRWARNRSGSGGPHGGGSERSGSGRRSDFPIPPMGLEQVTRFALWVGVSESELPMIETLHEGYMTDYEDMGESYDEAIQAKYDDLDVNEEGRTGWYQRRQVRMEVLETYRALLSDRENRFFEEFSVMLPPDLNPEMVTTIRRAQDRARERRGHIRDDWVLRGQPESWVDVGALLLMTDPEAVDGEARSTLIKVLQSYDNDVTGEIAVLQGQMEKLRSLQERLWSGEEYDQDLRQNMDKLRQKRRQDVSETALRLTLVNRGTMSQIEETLPEETQWSLREQYDKASYPEVFRDYSSLDKIFEQVIVLENITPAERQMMESMVLDHRSQYRELTDEMLTLAKARSSKTTSWPPNEDMMDSWMKSEQLKYQRGELNNRTRTRLQLMLGDERAVEVNGLLQDVPQVEEGVVVEVESE
ncbi:MAG: hypothetical protein VX527_03705 [Planctomycetota bacterium]|nr:hypothetical protein [Planctomycetota bacterium]